MFPTPVRVVLSYRQPRPEIQGAMWVIFRDFYRNDRAAFLEQFTGNTHYALYYTRDQLVGYTGLRLDLDKVTGRKVFLIHFGQTLILPGYQRRRFLARTCLQILWRYRKILLRYPSYAWMDRQLTTDYWGFPTRTEECSQLVDGDSTAIRSHLIEKYYTAASRPAPATGLENSSIETKDSDQLTPPRQKQREVNELEEQLALTALGRKDLATLAGQAFWRLYYSLRPLLPPKFSLLHPIRQ